MERRAGVVGTQGPPFSGSLPLILRLSQVRAAPSTTMAVACVPVLCLSEYAPLTAPFPSCRAAERLELALVLYPLFAGVCLLLLLLLLPESADSQGAGEWRSGSWSEKQDLVQAVEGSQGRQVEARSGGAPGPRPRGGSWRVCRLERLPGVGAPPFTTTADLLLYPFLPREGHPGSDRDLLPNCAEKEAALIHTHIPVSTTAAEGQGKGSFVEPKQGTH